MAASTAGIVIDGWKLTIFEKHLRDAEYTFSYSRNQIDANLITLAVECYDLNALGMVVCRANQEAAECSLPHGDMDDL